MWRRCRPLAPVEPAPAPAEHLARNKRLRGANRYPGAACPAARTPARTSYPAPTASLLRAAPSRRRSAGPAAEEDQKIRTHEQLRQPCGSGAGLAVDLGASEHNRQASLSEYMDKCRHGGAGPGLQMPTSGPLPSCRPRRMPDEGLVRAVRVAKVQVT